MGTDRVILIGADRTGHALLVLPLEQVRSDLRTLSALLYGRTFGEVRADAGASALLNTSLETWARSLQDEDEDEDEELDGLSLDEVVACRARDDDAFPEAVDFFGEDWDGWRPEPRLLTAGWLREAAPEVLKWLGREDDGWGFGYTSSWWLHPEEQARLTSLLQQRGYRCLEVPDLASVYDEPPRDVSAWVQSVLARAEVDR